jgi:hypothetical protein
VSSLYNPTEELKSNIIGSSVTGEGNELDVSLPNLSLLYHGAISCFNTG